MSLYCRSRGITLTIFFSFLVQAMIFLYLGRQKNIGSQHKRGHFTPLICLSTAMAFVTGPSSSSVFKECLNSDSDSEILLDPQTQG